MTKEQRLTALKNIGELFKSITWGTCTVISLGVTATGGAIFGISKVNLDFLQNVTWSWSATFVFDVGFAFLVFLLFLISIKGLTYLIGFLLCWISKKLASKKPFSFLLKLRKFRNEIYIEVINCELFYDAYIQLRFNNISFNGEIITDPIVCVDGYDANQRVRINRFRKKTFHLATLDGHSEKIIYHTTKRQIEMSFFHERILNFAIEGASTVPTVESQKNRFEHILGLTESRNLGKIDFKILYPR